MSQLYRVYLNEHDLTYPQLLALAVLWSKDHCSVSEIGNVLHLDSGTLTPLLKRLEQRKLVVRTRAAEDERRVMVSLTPTGKKMQDKLKCLPSDMLRDLNMTSNQVAELAGTIDSVTRQIEKSLEKHEAKFTG